MAVYVDYLCAPFGRISMCRMMADTTEELLAMADKIGIAQRWIERPGAPSERFDISCETRRLAVRAGAIEVTRRHMAMLIQSKHLNAKVTIEERS